jgi:hypothetical protein
LYNYITELKKLWFINWQLNKKYYIIRLT